MKVTVESKPLESEYGKLRNRFRRISGRSRAKCTADYFAFSSPTAEHVKTYTPRLAVMRGARYIRIVAETPGQRSSWCFVDTTNGDVLKCDGWKRPAKGARGNISDANNGCSRVRWTGVA